ncbi:small multi-drug export protein [Thermodesulfobacteriota bacterium]
MSLLKLSSLIAVAYLAAGRTGLVACCLYLGISPWATLIIALFTDAIQMPIYGLIIEISHRYMFIPKRLQSWFEKRSDKIQGWIKGKSFLMRLSRFEPLAVVAVSAIPIKGFGILSACILATILKYRRLEGTLLIMSGSFVGAVGSILILYFPVRWFHAL